MKNVFNTYYKAFSSHWGKVAVFIIAISSLLAGYDTFRNKGKVLICDISELFDMQIISSCKILSNEDDTPKTIASDDRLEQDVVTQECTDCKQIGVNTGVINIFEGDEINRDGAL